MSHKCQIDGSSAACFEQNNELWVKEYNDGRQREGRTYKVNFCPQCGFRLPRKSFFDLLHLPYNEVDNSISQFSHELAKSISEMNHNIALIKAFMSGQNTQNKCFLENEMELRKRIQNLEKLNKKCEQCDNWLRNNLVDFLKCDKCGQKA